MASRRYAQSKPLLAGERFVYCTECGALIADDGVATHDTFHAWQAAMAETVIALEAAVATLISRTERMARGEQVGRLL